MHQLTRRAHATVTLDLGAAASRLCPTFLILAKFQTKLETRKNVLGDYFFGRARAKHHMALDDRQGMFVFLLFSQLLNFEDRYSYKNERRLQAGVPYESCGL